MYAVIKTGGKQYRVQAGDLLVVEKLDGEPGAEVAFGEVLMLGEGEAVTVGAPLVDGAVVSGTLLETRKGEKVKISGFGNFVVNAKRPRKGRNPQTGEEIVISGRKVLTFKASQVLKKTMNGGPGES